MHDVGVDGSFQLVNGRHRESTQLAAGQLAKEPFDQVQPGGRGRREVNVHARMASEPAIDLRRLVGRVVVENDVDAEPFVHCVRFKAWI